MRGVGDFGNGRGDRGSADGMVATAPNFHYDNNLQSNNNTLVLDHAGGLGGSANAAFPSTAGYFDAGAGTMDPDASGVHHGGSYSLQQGELPAVDSSASGQHQVYYDETNGNILL
ncbi:hypothetical protein SEPCBS119000_005772 [Sporothrix epigloea]|uniref:Uncharacterized protein n=1 Tax=Sporothrix epigloea TaxID=1892477 RepID=A0ABP0E187_9PEZI